MMSWVGQYCIYVSELETAIRFYETLGLVCTSHTDLDDAKEAIIENPDKGGRLQLAQKIERSGPIEMGNAFWKLYVATNDIQKVYKAAVDAGYRSKAESTHADSESITTASVEDPDGYEVVLIQRHPWSDDDETTYVWLDQYSIYVSNLDRSLEFYELLGLECTSRNETDTHRQATLERTGKGGKMQLAQQVANDAPIDMGTSMWKLYVFTDDCEALHQRAVDAGHPSLVDPMRPERWPVTISFLSDPDGYEVELVQLD